MARLLPAMYQSKYYLDVTLVTLYHLSEFRILEAQMAGQAVMNKGISSTLADIHSVRQTSHDSGVGGTDTSAIGGEARKGNAEMPMWKDVKSMGRKSGNATTGQTGPNSGYGQTL